jgi:hypothetical protein
VWDGPGETNTLWWQRPAVTDTAGAQRTAEDATGVTWAAEEDEWDQEEEETQEEGAGEGKEGGTGRQVRNWKRNKRRAKARATEKEEKTEDAPEAASGSEEGGKAEPAEGATAGGLPFVPLEPPAASSQGEPGGQSDRTPHGGPQDEAAAPTATGEPLAPEEEEEEEGAGRGGRALRPRNAAGGVIHPPKTSPKQVFRKGGGRM